LEGGTSFNLYGGTIGPRIRVAPSGALNLYGTEFFLNGVPIAGLVPNEPFTIHDRDVTLSGLLADATPFSFDLNSTFDFDQDFFHAEAVVTVTLTAPTASADGDDIAVPEPPATTLLIGSLALLVAMSVARSRWRRTQK
jgi:hypothetical protein